MSGEHFGPNMKRLFLRFVARESVPDGGGFGDGVKFLVDDEHRKQVLEKAKKSLGMAMQAVKMAPDNPYGDDDEKIAGVILKRLEQREEQL